MHSSKWTGRDHFRIFCAKRVFLLTEGDPPKKKKMDELKVSAESKSEIEKQAGEWNSTLRPGGKLLLTVSSPELFAQAKFPLLMNDFVISPEESTGTLLCATKPEWEAGAKIAFVDEDDLLAADGLEPPAVPEDAGCSSRKPCVGCTCGRAEAQDAAEKGDDAPQATSNCGNCHKGDAFRCASCPHLGKPAFKQGGEGETLVLEMTDDL